MTAIPSLFDVIEKRDDGMQRAEEHSDEEWREHAAWVVRNTYMPGETFLAEEALARVNSGSFKTHDGRAFGPVIKRLAALGVITKTSEYRPAKTSNMRPSVVWRRV